MTDEDRLTKIEENQTATANALALILEKLQDIESSSNEEPDTPESIAARKRLERDQHEMPDDLPHNKPSVLKSEHDGNGNWTVVIPEVDEEHQVARRQLAEQIWGANPKNASAVEDYVKAGPLGLWYAQRKLTRELSREIKEVMIKDIEETVSIQDALYFSTDVMKMENSRGDGPALGTNTNTGGA